MIRICVVGLGYVGLPLAVEFGKKYPTLGFDINKKRIEELKIGHDITLEVSSEDLQNVNHLSYSHEEEDLANFNVYIITVPTPIDQNKKPDLTPLQKSSEMVGKYLKKGDLVIYESTVYPGCTEEVCVPILEASSNLRFNEDFYCGYSPERINPGDKVHTVTKITKVTSGSTPQIAEKVNQLYESIITAGTYLAESIKVAEAAKVIENCQRDLNIAFVNELALLFDKLNIDTLSVLKAAGTKWNFLPFRPGLVGGHCIGVDPYYLTHKAEEVGYRPEVILSGRRINDGMGKHIANKVVKLLVNGEEKVKNAKVLILGITFKENCPDIRNTRVTDIIKELDEFGCNIQTFDPWANKEEVKQTFGIDLLESVESGAPYNAVILAVGHKQFKSIDLKKITTSSSVIYDVKSFLNQQEITERL